MQLEAQSATSLSLIERVRQSDEQAWQRLVGRYSPLVFYWVRESGLQGTDAEDLVQEVFRSVFSGIQGFHRDQQGDSFRGWLRLITRSRLLDHYRKVQGKVLATGGSAAHHHLREFAEELSSETSGAASPGEASTLVQGVLNEIRDEFEDRTWRMFWAVTVDERYPVDVAKEFAVSTGAVYKAKSRVMIRLRNELSELLEME